MRIIILWILMPVIGFGIPLCPDTLPVESEFEDFADNQEVNCGWTQWGLSTSTLCSVSCGIGTITRTRTRSCVSFIIAFCAGSSVESVKSSCKSPTCIVHGGWSAWASWTSTSCSVTCGSGTQTKRRDRRCDTPVPSGGGNYCPGSSSDHAVVDCLLATCPKVHGGWSAWVSWTSTSCSVACGSGSITKSRDRTCNNPTPGPGGNDCPGSSSNAVSEICTLPVCVVHGGWSTWASWTSTSCSVTCGSGTQTKRRDRRCDTPVPSGGGNYCPESPSDDTVVNCLLSTCSKEDGVWSSWNAWSLLTCSVACGSGLGTKTRERRCDSPPPQNGGLYCIGSSSDVFQQSCFGTSCVDGDEWSSTQLPLILGSVLGGLCFLALLIICIVCLLKRKVNTKAIEDPKDTHTIERENIGDYEYINELGEYDQLKDKGTPEPPKTYETLNHYLDLTVT